MVCHGGTEQEMIERVYDTQDRIVELRRAAERVLAVAHIEAAAAWEAGAASVSRESLPSVVDLFVERLQERARDPHARSSGEASSGAAMRMAGAAMASFFGCLFCHGELYRLRPAPSRLTAFYLAVSAGGALGGLLVAVVAPLVFTGYYELGVGLVVLGLLAAVRFAALHAWARVASLVVLLGIAACAAYDGFRYPRDVRVASRSFYGVLRVKEYGMAGEESHLRRLVHGAIMHGEQYMHESTRAMLTTYYHEDSGIGAAIRSLGRRPARVGVIGLGTGTIAAYGRPGDVYRFYEIDARVISVAQTEFTYLGDSKAKVELALGDARLALEREAPQGFDVLAVDAFSSDVRVEGLSGDQRIKTFSGTITVQGLKGEIDAETFSADIRVTLDSPTRGNVSFSSFSGSLDSDVPISMTSAGGRRRSNNVEGTLQGGAGPRLRFHTFSGDVELRSR